MKKAILFAVLAFSINASAQYINPALDIYHQTATVRESPGTRTEDESENTPGFYPHEKFGRTLLHPTSEQFNSFQKKDSIYTWRWDSSIAGWTIASKRINIGYDASNNLTFFISQNWNGNTWGDSVQSKFTYDVNNNLTSSLAQRWNGNEWRIISQYRSTYDANNNKISEWGFNPFYYGIDSTTWSYDANNNQTSRTYIYFDGSAWMNGSQTTSTFDANNNQTSYLYQEGYDSTWLNSDLIIYTYDANNNEASDLHQIWSGSKWVNYYQNIFTYDANNNQTSDSMQTWDGNAWVNSNLGISTYDANNNQTSYINKKWGGNTWVNDYQSTRNYDANNNLIFSTYQEWNGSILGVWLNNSQSIYTYDFNNNLTRFFNQNWSGSAWVNYNQIIYTYDLNNNQISYLEQSWHGSTWVNDYQSTHNYDANNFLQSETDKYFDDSGKIIPIGELANWYTDSIHYYFHTITNIDELKAEDSYVSVFPNPSSGKFTLSSKNSISAIEIYNLLGERVYADSKFSQHTSTDIDLSGQGKGIFFINVYTGKLMHSSKVIVQ